MKNTIAFLLLFCAFKFATAQNAPICGVNSGSGSTQGFSIGGNLVINTTGPGNGPIRVLVVFAQFLYDDDNVSNNYDPNNSSWPSGSLPSWADKVVTPLIKSGTGSVLQHSNWLKEIDSTKPEGYNADSGYWYAIYQYDFFSLYPDTADIIVFIHNDLINCA